MSKQHERIKSPPYFSLSFTGRIGRLEFANRFVTYLVLFTLIYLLYFYVAEKGIFSLFSENDKSIDMTKNLIRLIFYSGYVGAIIVLYLRMIIMRLHDISLSGWWSCLLFLCPYLLDLAVIMLPMTLSRGAFYTYFFMLFTVSLAIRLFPFMMPGNQQLNQYGPPSRRGTPLGIIILIIVSVVGCYFLYRYITLQSLSIAFLYNL